MGAGAFNGRVREGIGFWAHRSNHQTGAGQSFGKLTDSRKASVGEQPSPRRRGSRCSTATG